MQSIDNRDVSDLTDGRKAGDLASRYPISAWVQIVIEFAYLVLVLSFCACMLIRLGIVVTASPCNVCAVALPYLGDSFSRTFLIWLSIALAATSGGACFGLKWLYHSVGKAQWNRDRILWRITVPPVSGVSATFFAFMIASGLVPFLDHNSFNKFYAALGYGFLVGYFSDNVLAALKRFAEHTFGTVDLTPSESSSKPHSAKHSL